MKLRIESYLQSIIIDVEHFKIEPFTQGHAIRLMVHTIDKNLRKQFYVCSKVELL